jgi:cystathionine gamma-synthase
MSDRFSTRSVHAGEEKHKPYGSLTTPIVQTSTYTFRDTAEITEYMRQLEAGEPDIREQYGRYGNPTQTVVEHKVAALEGGEQALLFASGMCAITTTVLALLSAGEHMIMARDAYRRTRDFAHKFLNRWGIEVTMVEVDQPDALAASIRPNTRLIFSETPTNPYLRVIDLERTVEIARQNGLKTMLDSTFATPINLRPLEYGVDLVIHSATKYMAGHNDLLAGAVVGSRELLAPIKETRDVLGGVSNPQTAYMLLRGLKTLDLRVARQNENGRRVAEFLEAHPMVLRVYYPGLASHPDHEVARRQMTGYGGVVSFEVDGDWEATGKFIDMLQLPYIGPTLGGVESIAQQQARFVSLDPEERQVTGIKDNLVRYAIGIEDAEDIIADLNQALDRLRQLEREPAYDRP